MTRPKPKLTRHLAVEIVQQILAGRARSNRPLTPEEAGRLAKVISFSGRSQLGDLDTLTQLRPFDGEYVLTTGREAPSPPPRKRFSVVDLI